MSRWYVAAAVCALLALVAGCGETTLFGKANPRFEVKAPNGVKIWSSRDDRLELEGLEVTNPTGLGGKLQKLTVDANASSVRREDVGQINALVNQQLAFNEGVTRFFAGAGQMAGVIMPGIVQIAGLRALRSSMTSCGVTNPDLYNQIDAIINSQQQQVNQALGNLQGSMQNVTSVSPAASDALMKRLDRLEEAIGQLSESQAATQPANP